MLIRVEQEDDVESIWVLNQMAFDSPAEAQLVDRLRELEPACLSLVAVEEAGEKQQVVGHILFSPVLLDETPGIRLAALAPMAVMPSRQKKGFGLKLVEAGLVLCRGQGYAGVVVLGYPGFYPKAGFVRASSFGIRTHYDVPDEALMAIELQAGSLRQAHGTIIYHDAFSELE